MRWSVLSIFVPLAIVSCADPDDRSPGGTGVTSVGSGSGITSAGTDGSSSGSGQTASDAGEAGSDGSGFKFDTPGGQTASGTATGGDNQQGCKKVDFLFVIDSSGSMQDEQQNLANSFPGFVDVIQSTLMIDDFHIMAVDTDAAGYEACATICQLLPNSSCNGIPCNQLPSPTGCDNTLGAGKIVDQAGKMCPIQGGMRYVQQGQPDLGNTFGCIARVGTAGSGDEQAIEAMRAAIEPPLNAPGACNEGFIRNDAILVVTIITDESDEAYGEDASNETATPGSPQDWYNAVVSVKNNVPGAVVVLGLIGDNDQPNALCQPLNLNTSTGAEPAPRLRQFVELFGTNGVVGSVCATDYAPFFMDAVDVIDTACDDFMPPG